MLTYSYIARNAATGEKIKSEVQAENLQVASRLIREQGYAPISIETKKEGGAFGALNRIKTKDKILFSRQLATLINAGLPLMQSLRTVGDQTTSKPMQEVINKVIVDIESGKSFADALSRHPKVFNRVFISLVAAGETSGTLDAALERISTQQEKDAEITAKIRSAMVYPLIVILVMGGVVIFMLTTVLPQVEELYKSLPDVTLPILTRVLLSISNFIINFWWVALMLVAVAGVFTSKWITTVAGRSFFDKMKMKMPPFDQLFMKVYMARFSRTGTTLVASGVPLVQMLEITSEAVDNVHISKSIKRAITKVKGGDSLSSALENDDNFLDLVPNMLRIGEQSGAIETMMEKTADYFEKEVDNQVKTISTIIEPVLMILLGIVAFTIVAAILLPIYSLVGQNVMS